MKRLPALALAAFGFSSPGFFADLQKLGLTVGEQRTLPADSFLPGLRYSPYAKAPLRPLESCPAVFCHDVDLQKRLNAEVRQGRLVLIAEAGKGFIAAVPSDSEKTRQLKLQGGGDVLVRKSLLIITPKTLLSTVVHELTHAEDNEGKKLKPLFDRIRALHEAGHLASASGRTINQFPGEVRAYDNEMRFILKRSRSREFLADEAPSGGGVEVRETFKMDFVSRRIQEIDWKIRQAYLPEFLKALNDEKLPTDGRVALLDQVRDLLPSEGPYSFRRLVQPHLP
ncbi:MAG: hypothetical protein KF802_11915 [Bdellovibrionaceae bacterium]|nr:hypothetical protein [Pseudobdellovibrionaceae bacterium]MBX3032820.1 hypothetical protein [Pseudobdellovibrionaceae bacterium]